MTYFAGTRLGTGAGITAQEENILGEILGQSVAEADIIYFLSFLMSLVCVTHLLLCLLSVYLVLVYFYNQLILT